VLRAGSEPFIFLRSGLFWVAFSGALLQTIAFLYFIFLIWARIRPPKAVSPD
jgi:hypothetical protein